MDRDGEKKMMQKKSYGLDTSPFFMKINRKIYYNVQLDTRLLCYVYVIRFDLHACANAICNV